MATSALCFERPPNDLSILRCNCFHQKNGRGCEQQEHTCPSQRRGAQAPRKCLRYVTQKSVRRSRDGGCFRRWCELEHWMATLVDKRRSERRRDVYTLQNGGS